MYATWVTAVLAALSIFPGGNAQIPTVNCPTGQYELIDASQRPTTRNCETKGFLAQPSLLGDPVAASSEDVCVQLCKSTSGCVSYGYSAANTTACALYNRRLIDMKYRKRMTDLGTVFSNMQCYKCSLTCPNNDAVRNGDFENETLTPWTLETNDNASCELRRTGDEDGFQSQSGTQGIRTNFFRANGVCNVAQVLQCATTGVDYDLIAWFAGNFVGGLTMYLDEERVFGPYFGSLGYSKVTVTVTPTKVAPTLRVEIANAQGTGPAYLDTVSMQLSAPA